MTTGFIAATIPAKKIPVSGTTLFHVAMVEFGDPLQWVSVAQMNGLTDPWIGDIAEILIPPLVPTGTQTGILDTAIPSPVMSPVFVAPVPPPASPTPQISQPQAPTTPMLDFSQPDDSQYIPLV